MPPFSPSRRWKPKPKPAGDKGLGHPALRLLLPQPQPRWWTVRFDGSCEGNGTASATGKWGFQLLDESGHTLRVGSGETAAAVVTNNVSEWSGVLEGVRGAAVAAGKRRPLGLRVEGDSRLVVEGLAGRWASKKPELAALRDRTRDLLAGMGLPWLIGCRCRCGHEWLPRDSEKPKVCPKCKSPRWDMAKLYERKPT